MREALPVCERGNAIALDMEDWHYASVGYANLAARHADLGELSAGAEAARKSVDLARRAGSIYYEYRVLGEALAWITHLLGMVGDTSEAFKRAEALQTKTSQPQPPLSGVYRADHLRRVGEASYARHVIELTRQRCEKEHWPASLSRSHRILGDLDADAQNHEGARAHYDRAFNVARGVSQHEVLIEALLGRGRWAARALAMVPNLRKGGVNLTQAFSDLSEALGYAVGSGYRIHESDIRVALAWAHLAAGNPAKGYTEAERAQRMSDQMGYHWGQVDATEILDAIRR